MSEPQFTVMHDKEILRARALAARRERLKEAGSGARPRFRDADGARLMDLTGGARLVAAFVPLSSEPDVAPVAAAYRAAGARVIVPATGSSSAIDAVVTPSGRSLAVDWAFADDPACTPLGAAFLRGARVVLVPAVLVDSRGVRLGRGAGWYDRALACRVAEAWTVGVVWPWEFVSAPLPADSHDVPVDMVLTAEGLYCLSSRAKEAESATRV